jgi:hypothetical protein
VDHQSSKCVEFSQIAALKVHSELDLTISAKVQFIPHKSNEETQEKSFVSKIKGLLLKSESLSEHIWDRHEFNLVRIELFNFPVNQFHGCFDGYANNITWTYFYNIVQKQFLRITAQTQTNFIRGLSIVDFETYRSRLVLMEIWLIFFYCKIGQLLLLFGIRFCC